MTDALVQATFGVVIQFERAQGEGQVLEILGHFAEERPAGLHFQRVLHVVAFLVHGTRYSRFYFAYKCRKIWQKSKIFRKQFNDFLSKVSLTLVLKKAHKMMFAAHFRPLLAKILHLADKNVAFPKILIP